MPTRTTTRQLAGLLGWLILCFAAAGIGAVASATAGDFYGQLVRPDWAPPAWLFSPVWTVLFFLMGVSAWLVWRTHGFRGARVAFILFIVQLAINALWSWLFFEWRRGDLAFAEVLLLWGLIAATVVSFWRLKPLAAVLLLPYLGWVTFASALTYFTWQRNPTLL